MLICLIDSYFTDYNFLVFHQVSKHFRDWLFYTNLQQISFEHLRGTIKVESDLEMVMKKFTSVLLSTALALSLFAAPAAYAAEVVTADGGATTVTTTAPTDTIVGGGDLPADNPSAADPPTGASTDNGIQDDGSSVDSDAGLEPAPEAADDASGNDDDGEQLVYGTLAEAQAAGIVAAVPDDPTSYDTSQIIVVLKGTDDQAVELSSIEASIADISTEPEAAEAEMNTAGVTANGLAVVSLPTDVSVENALLAAANDQHVAFAQPNFLYKLLTTEQDDGYSEAATGLADAGIATTGTDDSLAANADGSYSPLATINDPSRGSQWWLNAVDAYNAWDRKKVNGTVTVAVIDTGVRLNHQDLDANLWVDHAYNAVNGTALTTAFGNGGDIDSHGTHVAGILAAETNNGLLGAGISYNAKILPINAFQNSGGELVASSSWIIRAYDHILPSQPLATRAVAAFTPMPTVIVCPATPVTMLRWCQWPALTPTTIILRSATITSTKTSPPLVRPFTAPIRIALSGLKPCTAPRHPRQW